MANQQIKFALIVADMKQYELAQIMGVCESVLSKKLRSELPIEEQEQILKMIEEHKKEG